MTFLKPFPFQTECNQAFNDGFNSGLQRLAAVLFTGAGKTVIFAHMVHHFVETTGMRVAIFVDRDELVKQTYRQLHGVNTELRIGVVKGKRNEIWDVDVVIISIQTLARRDRKRLEQIPPDHFGLLIVDECHKAGARSYRDAFEYFGAFTGGPRIIDCTWPDCDLGSVAGPRSLSHSEFVTCGVCAGTGKLEVPSVKLAGFTATLQRADGGLGDIFQDAGTPTGAVYKKDMLWGIRNHYLVDVRPRAVTLDGLFDEVPTIGGDFTDVGLGAAMVEQNIGGLYAHALQAEAPGRQAIVFAPDVASAHHICAALNEAGRTAEVVVGSTPPEDRDLIYKRIRTGETQDLVNVDVATAGFDMPQISCVVPRPTSNQVVFIQQVGRGVRTWRLHDPSSPYPWIQKPKTDCVVLLINAKSKLKLCTLVDLSETPIKEVKENETLSEAVEREELEEAGKPAVDPKRVRITDVDLFTYSPFSFRKTTGRQYVYIPTKDWLVTVYPHTTAPDTDYMVGTVWCGKGAPRKGRTIATHVDLGYAMAIAESEAEDIDPVGTLARKSASWKKKKEPPSSQQLTFLRTLKLQKRFKGEIPENGTKVEVSELISDVVDSERLDGYTPSAPVQEEDDE